MVENSEAFAVNRFWVYCRRCSKVQVAKLCVRCEICLSDRFVLTREPRAWHDVNQSAEGYCLNCTNSNAVQQQGRFMFKCTGISHDDNNTTVDEREEKEDCILLQQIRSNFDGEACPICYERPSPVVEFTCSNRHLVCLQCFKSYCTAALENNTFVYDAKYGVSLACPVSNCSNVGALPDPHHFLLLSVEFYQRLKERALEAHLLRSGGLHCPVCDMAWEPFQELAQAPSNQVYICAAPLGCGAQFCGRCRVQTSNMSHICALEEEAKCQDDDAESASIRTIQRTTKQCPNCHSPTEKNDGCNHITCIACRNQWCWICGVAWEHGGACQQLHWF